MYLSVSFLIDIKSVDFNHDNIRKTEDINAQYLNYQKLKRKSKLA
jgi:hypothetical protein